MGGRTAERSTMANAVARPSSIMIINREEERLTPSAAAQRRNEGERPGNTRGADVTGKHENVNEKSKVRKR